MPILEYLAAFTDSRIAIMELSIFRIFHNYSGIGIVDDQGSRQKGKAFAIGSKYKGIKG
jgi:hypothetical protein